MKRIIISSLGLILMSLALSACGEQIAPPAPTGAYVITVSTNPTDTIASLENLYQAKAEVFRPESGFAVLTTDTANVSATWRSFR